MTRVSSFGYTQTMIAELLRNQSQMVQTEEQVNTGKKTNEYKGLSGQTVALLGAKTVQNRTNQYTQAGQQVQTTLSMYDNSLGTVYSSADDLKQALSSALGNGEIYGFSETLSQTLTSVATALNTQLGGNYIFSGTKTDTKPVTVQSLSDVAGLATSADAFQNNSQTASAQVDDGPAMQYGITASDAAGPLMSVIKALVDFNNGPNGPIDGKLNATQISFIQTQLANLGDAEQTVLNTQAENGIRQKHLDDVLTQHEASGNVVTGIISDIEDVDMATAVTNLNNDQTALQASYQIVSRLSQMSLLNYLS